MSAKDRSVGDEEEEGLLGWKEAGGRKSKGRVSKKVGLQTRREREEKEVV